MTIKEIKNLISGAIEFEETDLGLVPRRFTAEQINIYKNYDLRLLRAYTSAGIKMDFITDAESVSFSYIAYVEFSAQLYKMYYFDIYVNGVLLIHHGESSGFAITKEFLSAMHRRWFGDEYSIPITEFFKIGEKGNKELS